MKIDFRPVLTLNYVQQKRKEQQNSFSAKNFELSNFCYKPISFRALLPVTTELKTVENLHCPCCGIEMLNENKIEDLMCEVENIHTSKALDSC